jgi:hypothetical protein
LPERRLALARSVSRAALLVESGLTPLAALVARLLGT